jgi:hypothetical protein
MIPFVVLAPESAQAARFFRHYAINKIRKDSAPCVREPSRWLWVLVGSTFILDGFWAGIRRFFSLGYLRLFSGRGEIPHRRYPDLTRGARERLTL